MASFERSGHGRANRSLFYQVDKILYVEGGNETKGTTESFDGLFWRKIFAALRPDIKLKILPRGSKTSLLELADRLSPDGSDNSIVAMDRDYDGIFSRTVEKNNVIYTLGYSYENDIYSESVLSDLFYSLCPICDDNIDPSSLISELLNEFTSDVWWAHVADVCGNIGKIKIIDRDKCGKYLESNNYGSRPKVSKFSLKADLNKANAAPRESRIFKSPLKKAHLPLLSVGHLYAAYCMKVIMHLQHLYSSTQKLTKDGIHAAAISNFAMSLMQHPTGSHGIYYRERLATC